MNDRISVRGLVVQGHVGVSEQERARAQPLRVDIDIATDLSAAMSSDDVADTVDYAAVARETAAVVGAERCALLEHLADRILDRIAALAGGSRVTVEVTKLNVPIDEQVQSASVSIERAV